MSIADLSRVQVRPQHSSKPLEVTQKRKHSEMTKSELPKKRGTYKKGDSDNENASCHKQQSSDEEEGGAS